MEELGQSGHKVLSFHCEGHPASLMTTAMTSHVQIFQREVTYYDQHGDATQAYFRDKVELCQNVPPAEIASQVEFSHCLEVKSILSVIMFLKYVNK